MQSPDKVRDAIERAAAHFPAVQRAASGMEAIALGALAPFLPSLIDKAIALVPAEPAQLDELLDVAAGQVLALKSDPPDAEATAEPVEATS